MLKQSIRGKIVFFSTENYFFTKCRCVCCRRRRRRHRHRFHHRAPTVSTSSLDEWKMLKDIEHNSKSNRMNEQREYGYSMYLSICLCDDIDGLCSCRTIRISCLTVLFLLRFFFFFLSQFKINVFDFDVDQKDDVKKFLRNHIDDSTSFSFYFFLRLFNCTKNMIVERVLAC